MEFGEIIESAKRQFPLRWDNDEVCRFFNLIEVVDRENALEYLKTNATSRAFPMRSDLVRHMKAAGIAMAAADGQSGAEFGHEWRCKACNAHRPIGMR